MTPGPRVSCFMPMTGNVSTRYILQLFVFLSVLLGLVATTTAWADDEVDIDSATWRSDIDRLRVRGDSVPDNATVTIRYGEKEDNGAVIGTTEADGDGDWTFNAFNLNPVPCDVTAEADGEDDDKEVRRAPNDCSNDGGNQQPPANVPPTADANGPYTETTDNNVSFSSAGSNDPDGNIVAFSWDFGDGSSSNNANPNHAYAAAGTYTVTLTVTDNDGATASDSTTATINDPDQPPVNVPPTANANGPYSGTTGVAVNFTSAGSNDSDGNIVAFAWDFGDGGTSSAANPSHTYTAAGDYTVTLTVTDNGGATGTDSTAATITDQPPANVPPTANANGPYTGTTGTAVNFSSAGSNDQDGNIVAFAWDFGDGGTSSAANPSHTYASAATFDVTLTVTDNDGATGNDSTTAIIDGNVAVCNPATLNLSINSTSQDGCPENVLPERTVVGNNSFSVLAINDLGMHCGDLDTRISSILPPFQVLLGQVIQRGATPTLNPAGVSLEYSAASNPNDPAVGPAQTFAGLMSNGSTYKTNFWSAAVANGVYNAFYPFDIDALMTDDLGLPVPNLETLYINGNGNVVPGGTGIIEAVQHAMPGIDNPYGPGNLGNAPQLVEEHYIDKPFFVGFPFGYVAADVNWYEGAGIPFAAYDDFGRENAYPLVRVEARQANNTVATVDTVLPISGEASCKNCHADPDEFPDSRTNAPTQALIDAGLPVASEVDDPDPNMPMDVSVEYATDINILRLHDFRHGARYVSTDCDAPGQNCLNTAPAPCDISANGGNGDATCLTNQALVQSKPVVCQVCHYTPALDLAHVGPKAGAPGTEANGRNQVAHSSNSNVMHSHHGQFANLFPPMPAPNQLANGTITNQDARLTVLEDTCYQCHPGTNVQCLRGAMFNGGMLCNDCHGDMEQVGADFSAGVSPTNPGAFVLDQGNFYTPGSDQPRVPWANEPGCGSCHTGTATDNLAGTANTITNTRDIDGNVDGIRLRQAYRNGDAKATPIVPSNKRFAEPAVPASFNGFANPGAGNPQLYRVSTGHGGVMCEGCHGATHAEFPNDNPNANDNVMANQLQGHVGAIIECSTCHTNVNSLSPDGSLDSLQGPHGLHAVGDTNFARGDHRRNRNENECRQCHGQNGQGTVLSRMAEDRVLECKDSTAFCPNGNSVLFPKGHAVGCVECHGNEL